MTIETPTAQAVMARAAIFVRAVNLIDQRFQIADIAPSAEAVDGLHQEVLRLVTDCGCDDPIAAALDAEVAITEVVRAPHKMNHSRERRGNTPIFSYHVVSLANRNRAPSLRTDPSDEYTHKRLHFRRGHWRHYDNHKTWIKWTLVGDPDLGFVDKHYRL